MTHYTDLILRVIHQVIIPYSIDSHARIRYLRRLQAMRGGDKGDTGP
jgi:hypothetical protein